MNVLYEKIEGDIQYKKLFYLFDPMCGRSLPIGKLRNQQGLCLVIMKRSFNRYFNNVVHVGVFLK